MASKRENIKLKSEAGTYIYSEKNKSNTPDRITLKKYCPKQRKHVEFKETK
ncbi:MAG: 50S ribosomal protein L33 [Parachlamydiaceae bacterium]